MKKADKDNMIRVPVEHGKKGMDQPIEIIAVLFVTLAVAAAMIYFAQNIIGNTSKSSTQLLGKQDTKNLIINVSTISQGQAKILADSCYEQGYRNAKLDKTLCNIIRMQSALNPQSVFPTQSTYTGRDYNITAQNSDCRSFFIYYMPSSNSVSVEC